MKIPSNIITMLAGIALTLVSIWYGQNHGLMPVEASEDAALVDGLFNTMMTIGTAIFLLVEGVLIISIFRFRRQKGDETDGPPIEGNIPLEILWTAIPVVIVLVIGVYSFDVYNSMGGFDPEAADDPGTTVQVAMLSDEDKAMPMLGAPTHHHHHVALGVGAIPAHAGQPPDVTVNVTGMQYAWIFNYPDYGITTGELFIPAEKDVKLVMKAQDVIHAFWLPEFRLKQDTLPGVESELRFIPKRVGDYPIVCAELCGPYHGGMKSVVHVQEPAAFEQWLQAQKPAPPQSNTDEVAIVTPEKQTDGQFLTPFVDQLGVNSKVLEQLHPSTSDEATQQAAAHLSPAA